MPPSAWITFVAVSLVVYGGFAWCLTIALRKGAGSEDDGDA